MASPSRPPATAPGSPGRAIEGYGSLFGAFTCLAVGYAFAHAADGRLTVWQLLACRALLYLAVLAPWVARHPREARGADRLGLMLRGVFGTAMLGCLVHAIGLLPLSTATVLGKTTPLWSILVVLALFAVPPILAELAFVPLALAGVALILHPEGTVPLTVGSSVGIGLALAAGFFNALEYVTLHRLRRTDSASAISLWYAGVMLAVALPMALGEPLPRAPEAWAIGLLFGLSTFLGQMLLALSLGRVTPIAAATGALSVPVFSAVIGWAVFAEQVSALEFLGGLLVITAAGAVIWLENRRGDRTGSAAFRWQAGAKLGAG
jgi:drug/metabolite transporter (DMT)-like permease